MRQSYDVHHIHAAVDDVSLNHQVELFWTSESLGTNEHYKLMSVEDSRAERTINDTISKKDDHYCVGLLWKHDSSQLPFNRQMAEIQLHHLKRRLERDEELQMKYRSVINGYIAMGHARKLTQEEAEQRSSKTWYLPHHPIVNTHKPDKLRVVFDAAAKFGGTSLNEQLLQGPNYINNLAGVLMRSRQEGVTLKCSTKCECQPRTVTLFVSCGGLETYMIPQRSTRCRCTYLMQPPPLAAQTKL